MDNAAVVAGLVLRDRVLFFQDQQAQMGILLARLHGKREANNSAANDRDVVHESCNCAIWQVCNRHPNITKSQITKLLYCTVSDTFCECVTIPSVAVTEMLGNVPRTVGVNTSICPVPDLLVSACAAAVTVTFAGLGTTGGAVYRPVLSTMPFAAPPATAQVTLLFEELLTTAVNCCCVRFGGHAFPASLAYRLTVELGLTVTLIGGGGGGWLFPPPPLHATITPISMRAMQTPEIGDRLNVFRPATPNITMPTIGRVIGNHGERLSARR